MGIGATCALRSALPKRGAHRCFVAVWHPFGLSRTYELTLAKDVRSREQEDEVVARLVLASMADAIDSSPASIDLLRPLGIRYGACVFEA